MKDSHLYVSPIKKIIFGYLDSNYGFKLTFGFNWYAIVYRSDFEKNYRRLSVNDYPSPVNIVEDLELIFGMTTKKAIDIFFEWVGKRNISEYMSYFSNKV